MKPLRVTVLVVLAMLLGQLGSWAQAAERETNGPTIGFSFNLPGSEPGTYSFAVQSTGKATYRSNWGAGQDGTPEDSYSTKFELSAPTRNQILELAKRAHYFQGDFDYHKGNLANTGTKTLSYTDESRKFQTSYNYTTNAAVQELTRIFEGMSATLEFGHRLEKLYSHQKLGLEEELKRMEDMEKNGQLEEISAVAPLLEKIAHDPSVMHIGKERAQRLLRAAGLQAGLRTTDR
ncbi:MAG TPA: hypothetical protein VFA76_10435 [Terriglobales bacterium]|nr:hypothetical protein [Terriglobales bacterium]